MTPSKSRAIGALLALFTGFGMPIPAQSASFNYTDGNCNAFSFADNGNGSFSVTCNTLVCAVTLSKPNPLPGQWVDVDVSCNPPATTYTWSKLNAGDATCAQPLTTTGSHTVIPEPRNNAVALGCIYKVTVSDPVNGNGTKLVPISWTNAPPVAPSNCSITPSPASLPAGGGSVTLSASCSSGGVPTSWAWTGGFAAGNTAAQVSGSITQTTTFGVTASNATGSASASSTVNVAGSTGGGGGSISCAAQGFAKTITIDMNWANPGRGLSSSAGGFGYGTALVTRFTTGANSSPDNYGRLVSAEYQGQNTPRTAMLSDTPCDFTNGVAVGGLQLGPTVTVLFTVGANSSGNYYPALQPNTTYYLNEKNEAFGTSTCAQGDSCNVFVDLIKPSGM